MIIGRLKTGTPPRLDGNTINYDELDSQPADELPSFFSFLTEKVYNKQISCGVTYTNNEGRLHFTTQEPEENLPKIINLLTNAGCHIQRVETTKSSLEDVFLSLTGKGINE